jgi:hypothetical protein
MKIPHTIPILFAMMLSACAPAVTPQPATNTPTPVPDVPTLAPTPTLPPTPTPLPILTPIPTQTPLATSLDGLVYANMELAQIFRIFQGDTRSAVLNGISGQFSADGNRALFEQGGDLWLAEPMDNLGTNLTNTPDRNEGFSQWWPSNPGKVVFNSVGINEAQEKNWTHAISGYPSMINLDGSGYIILADAPSYTPPALSPDGKTMAFDLSGAPMLYDTASGASAFDPNLYGYQPDAGVVFTSPSFSPDGHWLTWWISQDISQPQEQFALVVFDLAAQTSFILHAYTPLGGTEGWLDSPLWSPGGQWIAFQTRGEVTPWDLWVTHIDGNIGNRFGLATNPAWAPDSQRLVYIQWPPRADSYLAAVTSIIEVPSWTIQDAGLPPGSIPLGWLAGPAR